MKPKIIFLCKEVKRIIALSMLATLVAIVSVAGASAQQPDFRPTYQTRAVQPVAITGELIDLMRALDGRQETRATSGKPNYSGMSITIDLGGEQPITGVWQDHGRWPTFYPGAYRVEVAATPGGPWMKTWEGAGNRGDSKALFEAVRARYIRITATGTNGGADEWSIAELKAYVDPGQTPRTIPASESRPPESRPGNTVSAIKDVAFAFDRNMETRASSGTWDYAGMSFIHDLGGEYELSRVVQLHGRWAEDYPAQYKIEVSRRRDENSFREVWSGRGQPGRSIAQFNPVITRYIRITALEMRDRQHWWSIAELRTNRDPDVIEHDEDDSKLERPIRNITGQGFINLAAAIEGGSGTAATTRRDNYEGSWILLDLGGSYTISKVTQIHRPDDRDFPARYRVEVSNDGNRWQTVWEGEGERERSTATFNAVRARYVRITALADRNNQRPWTIHSLRVRG